MSGHNLAAWVNKAVGLVVLSLLATGLCAAPAIAQESGTSTRIGNSKFDNFSNGTNCTTTRIRRYSYTNCN